MDFSTKLAVDQYLTDIVNRHSIRTIANVGERVLQLLPHIQGWANGHKYELSVSGSYAKGTSVAGITDLDLFISLDPSVSQWNTLEFVYTSLRNRLNMAGYFPREQNVSIGIEHNGLRIDLVPGVRHHPLGHDHSLWKRKGKTWTKSNVEEHIRLVVESQRAFDIRMVKVWRMLRSLEFPSFYLELSVIEALKGRSRLGDPSGNFVEVMRYLTSYFTAKVILDPANQNNVVSEELSLNEKMTIAEVASDTLNLTSWEYVIW